MGKEFEDVGKKLEDVDNKLEEELEKTHLRHDRHDRDIGGLYDRQGQLDKYVTLVSKRYSHPFDWR